MVDRKFLELTDLDPNKTYLAKYAKRINWEPYKIVDKDAVMKRNGVDTIMIQFMDGTFKSVRVMEGQLKDSINGQSLKEIPKNYFSNRIQKLEDQMKVLQEEIDLMRHLQQKESLTNK